MPAAGRAGDRRRRITRAVRSRAAGMIRIEEVEIERRRVAVVALVAAIPQAGLLERPIGQPGPQAVATIGAPAATATFRGRTDNAGLRSAIRAAGRRQFVFTVDRNHVIRAVVRFRILHIGGGDLLDV